MQLPEKKNETGRRQMFGKGLCIFFALMLVFTIVSRLADSVIVAKVTTQKFQKKNMSSSVKGNGTIDAKESSLVYVPGGYVIESCVSQGDMVQSGDVILTFFAEDLEKKKVSLEQEIQKLKLQLAQAELSGEPDVSVPAAESAGRGLEQAQRSQQENQDAYAKAEEEYRQMEEEYQQRQNELNNWKQQLDQAAMQSGTSGQEEQARQNEQQGQDQQENQPPQDESANGDSERAAYEEKLAELNAWYEGKRAELDAKLQAAEQQLKQGQQTVESAENALTDAKKSDAAAKKNQQKQQQNAGYTAEGIRLDVEEKEKELAELSALMEAEGKLYAGQEGTVLSNALRAGTVSSGSDFIPIGTGGLTFQAKLTEKQAAKITEGDTLTIQGQKKAEAEAVIEQIRLSEGEEGEEWILTAAFSEETDVFQAGQQASFSIQKKSEQEYRNVLPLSVIRSDSKGYYCLAVETKKTILGEEYQAIRIDLTIEDKDDNYAAVSGALEGVEEIIAGGNKNVEAGDRVRLMH